MSAIDRPSQTEIFATFSQGFRLPDTPEEVLTYARLLVLDLLGCAIGGLGTPEETAARKACLHMDQGAGRAALWGTGLQATPRNAAMFNGISSHVLELDDFLGIDHTGAVVLPALFAVMDHEQNYDETKFFEAMVLGYEIGRRMLDTGGGYSTHNSAGWHTTGTLGAFAAAVAVSKYMGLSEEHTVSAVGLAGSIAGGTWAFNADGSMSKRFHPGIAAQNGITAAYMAREGFTGPKFVIEAEWGGYFAQFAPNHDCDISTLFDGLGTDLRLGWTGIKPYACCRGCHSAIDAMHEIREQHPEFAADVETIQVSCSPSQYRQLGNANPKTVTEAQLSMPFAIALALRFDTIGTDRFNETAISDPLTASLMRKVEFDVQEDWPVGKEPKFRLSLANDQHFDAFIRVAKGDRSNPVPTDQVVAKFRHLVAHRLSEEDQNTLLSFGLSQSPRATLAEIAAVLGRKANVPLT